ncbi:MAG: hypothetical protein AB1425_04740 [Actinomycetota bacterium]
MTAEREGSRGVRPWHVAVLVFGFFLLGLGPLLVTVPGIDGQLGMIEVHGTPGNVSPEEAGADASPLDLPPASSAWSSAGGIGCGSVDLRLLVLSANGEESTLPAIRQVLDYVGVPYAVYVAEEAGRLTPQRLSDGCHGFYQGVVLATGNLAAGDGESALSEGEWEALEDYEREYDVRRAAWYVFPNEEYGFEEPDRVDTRSAPIYARYTGAGEKVFSYTNAENPLPISGAYAYLAKPLAEGVTPLLVNGRGDALAVVRRHSDGRETLALTFDSAPALLHNLVLDYGIIDWVTKGLFLGERRVYLSAQVDDFFIPNELTDGGTYRTTGEDLSAVAAWQEERQKEPALRDFRLDLAFNAYGTTGVYVPDTLTPVALRRMEEFKWINHTYRHLDLDEVGYATAINEFRENDDWAGQTGLESYSTANAVTPEHSGLRNPQVMRAAREAGVRYMVGDTSDAGYDNPSPNAGFYHPLQPSILMIPRYPTNLGYDVSTPQEWTASYNDLYRDVWGRDLAYEEVLDRESDVLLSYLLKGDINPLMFHQANLRAYDGENTLLGDLLDRTFEKYLEVFELPILSPAMDDLGRRIAARMRYNGAGVQATVSRDGRMRLLSKRSARIPVTGLRVESQERYGGEYVSYVELEAGEPVTLSVR